ncbi:MAG: hypothetical protein U1A27_02985 [Phycisphaerae bacterium]
MEHARKFRIAAENNQYIDRLIAAQRVHSIRDLYDAVEACIAADEAHDRRVQSNVDDQRATAEIEDRVALELFRLVPVGFHENPGECPDNQHNVTRRSKATSAFAAINAQHRQIERDWSAAHDRADALLRPRDGAGG